MTTLGRDLYEQPGQLAGQDRLVIQSLKARTRLDQQRNTCTCQPHGQPGQPVRQPGQPFLGIYPPVNLANLCSASAGQPVLCIMWPVCALPLPVILARHPAFGSNHPSQVGQRGQELMTSTGHIGLELV